MRQRDPTSPAKCLPSWTPRDERSGDRGIHHHLLDDARRGNTVTAPTDGYDLRSPPPGAARTFATSAPGP
jgi:hypothetical protein